MTDVNRRQFLAAANGFALAPGGSGWKAGAAREDITPKEPIWMAGYGGRTKPSEGVRQPIFVKALAIQDQAGRTSVAVTSDILGFTRNMAAEIAARCKSRFGLERDRLALTSSHTHSGPVTDDMLRPAYPLPPEQVPVIGRYTAKLIDQVVEAAGKAIQSLAPATLTFEQGLAGFGVNRRRVALRHLPGPVDHDVPVLAVRASSGELRAVLFGYACHNTTMGDYLINGDYAGYAQEALEKKYPGAVAMFVAGCGADINPLPRYQGRDARLSPYTTELPTMYGRILAIAVELVLSGKMRPLNGPLTAVFETVDLPFRRAPTREELQAKVQSEREGSRRRYFEYLLQVMDRDGRLASSYPYPVQVWRFGDQLNWIVLGGEVVTDFSLRFKAQYGWDNTWVAGYSNDVFAYIPSLRVLKEGGYEGGGAMVPYGQPAPFAASVEEIVAEKVQDLFERAKA